MRISYRCTGCADDREFRFTIESRLRGRTTPCIRGIMYRERADEIRYSGKKRRKKAKPYFPSKAIILNKYREEVFNANELQKERSGRWKGVVTHKFAKRENVRLHTARNFFRSSHLFLKNIQIDRE